jgi:DNA polymerase-3 subunit gamma/tau
MSLFPEDPPYQVLARKYRPGAFDALIGQDAVVQTLANAIRSNRLAQAWLLTGVRGVGKTSTARIIAKALNCTGPDGSGGPTIAPCGVCANCTAIGQGQHIDCIEMDAASNTGVDNIREIIDSVRYASVSARYKVYIIDEVHMLSKGAFNALLKTLEEPPAHVKFIFATTEVQKVPATILSRCQRFDLRRVATGRLAAHFHSICVAEAVEAEPEALDLIARASEGSVRDGLSILDQAIAMGAGAVRADQVRDMLGLADRGRSGRLLDALLGAQPAAALAALDEAHAAGAEPQAQFVSLLDLVHLLARSRADPRADATLAPGDHLVLERWGGVGFATLHRVWQLLLKGLSEINQAPDPQQAAEMAVLRIAHAAGLPDPEQLARMVAAAEIAPAPGAALPPPAPPTIPADFAALVALFEENREALIAKHLVHDVACLGLKPGELVLAPVGRIPGDLAARVRQMLAAWTGIAWSVQLREQDGRVASLHQEAVERSEAARRRALADPLVAAFFDRFPGTRLEHVGDPPSSPRSASA